MNARGIPAQSEPENLEKDYSYTVNEMTGERVPFGEEPKHGPSTAVPPTGDKDTSTRQQEAEGQSKRQPRRESREEQSEKKSE